MHTTSNLTAPFRLSRPIRHAALLLVVLLTLAGCGTDDATDTASEPEAAVTTEAATEGATNSEAASSEADSSEADSDVVALTAVDYAFEGLPDEVAVGTELTLQGAPDAEPHELVAFRLDDDDERTVEELLVADGPPPGTFAGVLVAPPGGAPGIAPEGPVVLDQAGRYLLVCFIPTGTTPEAFAEVIQSGGTAEDLPEVGPPHFVQGMVAELTVS